MEKNKNVLPNDEYRSKPNDKVKKKAKLEYHQPPKPVQYINLYAMCVRAPNVFDRYILEYYPPFM